MQWNEGGKWGGGNVWREMQMQAGAMRMLLAVYTDVRRRHANRSSVAQNIPLSAVVEIDRKPAKKKQKGRLTVGVPRISPSSHWYNR
jgi:hypothetical protein